MVELSTRVGTVEAVSRRQAQRNRLVYSMLLSAIKDRRGSQR